MTEPRPGVDPATSTAGSKIAMIRARFMESEERPYEPELRASAADVPWLLAEIQRLRADLAAAQRKITAALVEHHTNPGGYCDRCALDWPCPTIAALSAAGTGRTEGDEQ